MPILNRRSADLFKLYRKFLASLESSFGRRFLLLFWGEDATKRPNLLNLLDTFTVVALTLFSLCELAVAQLNSYCSAASFFRHFPH